MAVPRTIDEVDAKFLSGVLRDHGVAKSAVVDASAQRIAVGEGFLGELARISLTYADGPGSGPATVIAKIPTTDSGLKPLGMMLNVYEREHRAYNEVIPQLQIRTPEAYYNGHEPATDDYCLVLEDIAHLRAGDHHAGASLADAEVAMTAAAGVHGRWWGHVDDLDWVPPIDSPLNLGLQSMLEASWPTVVDQYGELLGPEMLDRMETWIPTCSDMLIAYGEMSYTLVHNDFRLDNMFFDDGELVLIDWQIIGRGDGLGDVCPFLSCNLDPALRRIHETDLLRRYHDAITAMGAGWPDFDDLVTSYRVSLNFWMAIWCNSAVTSGETTKRGEELFERVLIRGADAIMANESWELTGDHSWRPRIDR